ncbi:DNA excision repair protein (Rad26L), putative [Talaromyces stipitatus ATCC 10500]|uniref:DNA excision repair protein (Rad26L), putative n=1 Tax=Talaromyces stipitatus (strain ATCC 10500 / CBS 375.48 / QM 6759 / NRRL 1006) TaxID=441959 RepID=B8M8E4_TALSN|nr:DNA excision repair protein (Rad26L), putative [Talaromyces stipitatus ATCC 10500]EED20457.1 DNA excision repair protein (Rad26L), putative [Talaromyces stipitatus ATCC 10500]
MPSDIDNSVATATDSDGDDDDDLNIVSVRPPSYTTGSHKRLRRDGQEPSTTNNHKKQRVERDESPDSSSDNILDDEFNDSEAAYQQFKNRKSIQRKRASLNERRARKGKAKETEKDGGISRRRRSAPARDSLVGRVPSEPSRKPKRVMREYTEDLVSSEDDLMEHTLPDFLQQRRSQFDARMNRLKEAGLRLPPNFDDVEFSDDENLEFLKEKPFFRDVTPPKPYEDIPLPYSLGLIPAPIAQWLRDYQVEGAAFLHELFVYQKGGILGDDMGLGKTVQVIAFLTAAYGKTADERDMKRMRKLRRSGDDVWYPRTLIVCPGTLIENWKSELQRWGWWAVGLFHGDRKEEALQAAKAGRLEILVTTYVTYRMNKDAINMVEWDCVVADECHQIKERKSETTIAMNEINALCRIGLTGTAIQNKYEELWTLLNWTNPGKLGPVTAWKRAVAEPLKIGQSHDATLYQLSKARKTAKKLVQNLLPEFFLRRMKTLIADQLPKKSDRVVFCPLTDTQADAYENFLNSDALVYIKNASELCDCGSGKKSGWCCYKYLPSGQKWQSYVFPAIQNLQKLSNHLAILIPQGQDPREKQDKDLEMLQLAVPDRWRELYQTRDSIINYANPEFCGKWKVLRKLLKWWHANGDKVLVFSHSVRLLKMLQMLFNHTSYNVSYLDGAMSYEDRAKAVDEFNSDPQQFVFLISTRAGGVGLNIVSANKVVVVDPNWNPSHDLQAQDRAYRIGQHRDVEVFRLISAGTIEEIVYARQIYKQQQANIGYNASTERRYFKGVQEKKDQKGEIFGLSNLFEYQNNNIVLRDIVNKTNIAESKAGVQVIGVDLEQDDDDASSSDNVTTKSAVDDEDDGTLSQIAALIRGETPSSSSATASPSLQANKKHDPIHAILASAGVEYSHLNNEVIGSSKVEERLSRRAEQANDPLQGDKQVFDTSSQPTQTSSSNGNSHRYDNFKIRTEDGSKTIRFKFHPSQDVRKRQFCSMAQKFGFPNATEFALVVEGMTQAQRRACLERWYRDRREMLLKEGGGNVQSEEDIKSEDAAQTDA